MHDETVAQEEVSLRDYLDLLRRRSAIIIQTVVAALVIGIVVAVVSSPVYQSSGRLLVTQNSPGAAIIQNAADPLKGIADTSQVHNIETQLEVLMNGELTSDAYKAAGVQAGDPRVHVAVNRPNEDVDIISINVEAHKAEVARDVAENMMVLYIDEEAKQRGGDIRKAIEYATGQLKEANTAWKDYSDKLQAFGYRTQIADYAGRQAALSSTFGGLSAEDAKIRAQIAGTQKFMEAARANLAKTPPVLDVVTVETNPSIEATRQKLFDLQVEYDAKLALLKPEHPAMKTLAKQMAKVQDRMNAQAKTLKVTRTATNPVIEENKEKLRGLDAEMAQYQENLAITDRQMAQVKQEQLDLSKLSYSATQLKNKIDFYQEQVKILESKLSDLKLREIAQTHPISILNHAALNPMYVRPKRPMIIMMSALAGLFLGVCFALLSEFMDDRVNSPEDARRLLGVPALGYIPRIEKEDQRLLSSARAGGSLLESYRVLRSNVRFAAVGEPLHTIMVTSTAPGEGKSVTAANLAIAMALDGKKVILVDADLRRPTVHEKFGVRNTPGMTNVLVGAMNIDLALQDTEVENLKLMTSGPIPPNPAELLNSRAFDQIVEQMKERADVVILDSPPCLSVADAQVLAANMDGLIYVIQLGSTKKSALKHGHELLRQAHARILGVVYNKVQVDGRRNDYYYGYYSYYHKQELPGKGGNGNGAGHKLDQEWEGLLSQAKDAPAATIAEAPARRSGKKAESNGDDKV